MADLTIIDQPRQSSAGGVSATPNGMLTRLRALSAQPAVQRGLPLAMLGGLGVAGLLAWSVFSAAPQRDLLPGLGEADKAAVAQALDAAGVAYEINGATGTLGVSGDDFHRARMLLAAQGLPKSAPAATDALDAMPLGASEAVERERLQGSREADLARTIEAIDAVQTARVHLAVETPSLFVRDRVPPRASVMVTLRQGRNLADPQVAAISNLVSSSVPGLPVEGVSIVDQAGRLLSNPDGEAGAMAGQLAVQRRVEDRYREAVARVLTPIVGVDGFTAEVHADLDWAATDATRESFPEASRALRSEDQRMVADEGSPAAVGIPGALSNTAPPATTVATTPQAASPATPTTPVGTRSQDVSRRFELGREVSVTRGAPGNVRRLSLAVALKEVPGKKLKPADLANIEALVRGAVGADQARGDVIAVSARPFVVAEVVPEKWHEAAWIAPALRFGGLLLATLLAWFLIGRRLLKRYDATTKALRRDEMQTLLEGEVANAPTSQQRVAGPVTLDMIEAAPGYADRAALVRDYVRQDPARAAKVLQQMIRHDELEVARG